jgi:uncharacterized protein YndB with AHSA1/START domain
VATLFEFDRSWRFDVPVEQLWDALAATDDYPRWWSWLDHYEAGPLEAGTVATFRVRPPLPYTLSFSVTVDEVIPKQRVIATVGGDVEGPARLEIEAVAAGSRARLSWELALRHRFLARIEPVARPAMLWGHDVVVSMGVRQFRRTALRTA